ncbi:glycosyltransferase [Arenibacter sp. M-2]|uniref:glycosyltransferase n=1 Tax=Arenibacter sp. M-2 TaxID=3053612 RepID=UPI00257114E7|nr:glycosyltransferase [Arenibacter sp. M-2]MDL5514663.1 glycosyltransferase [Arenibacter sp. M-2]
MRIIEIIASLGPGGAETLTKDLSIGLKSKGAEVLVIVVDKLYNETSEQFKIKNLEQNGIKIKSLGRRPGKKSIRPYLVLNRFINDFKPNIVHIHSFIAGVYSLPFAISKRSISFFQTIHNTKIFEYNSQAFVQKTIFKILFKKIYCSEEAKIKLYKKIGEGAIINNGINTNAPKNIRNGIEKEWSIPKDATVLLNVGRVVKQKNQILLIKMVEQLNNLSFQGKLYLLICGNYSEDLVYKEIQDIILDLNYPNQIKFLGVRNDIIDLMYSSDFYISSSIHEGLPITALEAMSVGVPLILSPINEHITVFGNQKAVYIPSEFSVESFVKLFNSLNYPHNKNSIIRDRTKFNHQFSMESCVNQHYKFFKKQLNTNY